MRHERIAEAKIAAAAWPTTMEGLMLVEPPETAIVQEPARQAGPTAAQPYADACKTQPSAVPGVRPRRRG